MRAFTARTPACFFTLKAGQAHGHLDHHTREQTAHDGNRQRDHECRNLYA